MKSSVFYRGVLSSLPDRFHLPCTLLLAISGFRTAWTPRLYPIDHYYFTLFIVSPQCICLSYLLLQSYLPPLFNFLPVLYWLTLLLPTCMKDIRVGSACPPIATYQKPSSSWTPTTNPIIFAVPTIPVVSFFGLPARVVASWSAAGGNTRPPLIPFSRLFDSPWT